MSVPSQTDDCFLATCNGQVEPLVGVSWQASERLLGQSGRIDDAMTIAERSIQAMATTDRRFIPRLIYVRDNRDALAISGVVARDSIRWCAPVASDAEAEEVLREAGERFSKAESLRDQELLLRVRLVDPKWRAEAFAAYRKRLDSTVK